MMLRGESPRNLFDFIMTRFEPEYNPEIIYDASCLVTEYGLNRELRRFMGMGTVFMSKTTRLVQIVLRPQNTQVFQA